MANDYEVNAVVRDDAGKGASRRLRRAGLVPAILYGGEADPQMLSLKDNEVKKHLESESFYSRILTVNVDGGAQQAVLRDVQWHPARGDAMHLDFLRVSATERLRTNVPLHFLNEEVSVGVKMQGGLLSRNMNDVEVLCLPGDLPEFIAVDVMELKVGESIHLSQLDLPEGVEIAALAQGAEHDLPVVSMHGKASEGGDDEEQGSDVAGDSAEDAAE